ncbi:hypothetical protein BH11PLA2_BH11PLA2_09110 [soil metagenome]
MRSVFALFMMASVAAAQSPFPNGTPVGTPVRVGSLQPKVGTAAGKPVGYAGSDGKPINTQKPEGTVVNMNNLAAPLVAPLPAGMEQPKSVFQATYDKWKAMLGFAKPAQDLSTNWVPGISRRNRERHKDDWRRD